MWFLLKICALTSRFSASWAPPYHQLSSIQTWESTIQQNPLTPNGSQNRSNSPTNQNPSRNPPRKHQKFGLKPVETTIPRSSRDGSPPHLPLMWASAQMGKKPARGFEFRCRNRRRARRWTRVSIVSAQIGIWRGKEIELSSSSSTTATTLFFFFALSSFPFNKNVNYNNILYIFLLICVVGSRDLFATRVIRLLTLRISI